MKSICPGCRVELEEMKGPSDPYGVASPACWAAYCEVMAREFSGEAHFISHRMSVDSYMAQHPSNKTRAGIQSVWVHLVGLCLILERGAPPSFVSKFMASLTRPKRDFEWLNPPLFANDIKVTSILASKGAKEHEIATLEWAKSVWTAWSFHHQQIRDLIDSKS